MDPFQEEIIKFSIQCIGMTTSCFGVGQCIKSSPGYGRDRDIALQQSADYTFPTIDESFVLISRRISSQLTCHLGI